MEQQSVVSATRNQQDLIGRRSAIDERIASEIQSATTHLQSLKKVLGCVETQHREVLGLDDQIRRMEEQRDREQSGCISLLALTDRDLQRSFGIVVREDDYDWLAFPTDVHPLPADFKLEVSEIMNKYAYDHSNIDQYSPLGWILLQIAHAVNTVLGVKTGMMNLAHNTDLLHTFAQHKSMTLAGRADYTLWYRDPEIARIHLVVVEADPDKPEKQAETRAIAYMLMVQESRWQACDMLAVVYGLVHDENSRTLTFLRLDTTRKIQRTTERWEFFSSTRDFAITSILWNIFREARMYEDSSMDPDYEDSLRDPDFEGSSTCTGRDKEDLTLSDC
ncbi:uncharacterized protein BO66DRAFT_401628 [Aspergillus aculeatinus CBS 121060]|uniref:Uncharacterized protein n=1 Tax=Aspergillus aculeatinus CBS 121060 TaxID=1448322 RepID=A0ACD1H8G8_9EURO|nr:hypothetical protein BO66DRAFT_401628 [Aspergillus aculeatinus CBS 121060]RAH69930.1 hypothetical protein BO66DRAFT_401628 [Aspergillus aculeatinus CBS 121060]